MNTILLFRQKQGQPSASPEETEFRAAKKTSTPNANSDVTASNNNMGYYNLSALGTQATKKSVTLTGMRNVCMMQVRSGDRG